jgi:ribonuclease HI
MKFLKLPSVYTDASYKCTRVKPRLGLGVYFPQVNAKYAINVQVNEYDNIDTNMGEMMAIAIGIRLHSPNLPLVVYTDSMCSIKNIYGCYDTLKYQRLVKTIRLLIANRKQETWIKHVPGHSGVVGNVIADQLARKAMLLD